MPLALVRKFHIVSLMYCVAARSIKARMNILVVLTRVLQCTQPFPGNLLQRVAGYWDAIPVDMRNSDRHIMQGFVSDVCVKIAD